jgi:hypothetical protein
MAKQPDQDWRQWVLGSLPRMEMTEPAAGFTPAPANPQPFSVGMHLQPQFDVGLLPPGAAEKLRLLRLHRDDALALTVEFEQVRQASLTKIEAEGQLKRLTDHPQQGGFGLTDDNRSVISARRTLAKAIDDFERLKQLQEVRAAAFQSASAALVACEDWLKNGRPGNTTLEPVEVDVPKPAKGENLLDQIEARRRRVRELRADAHRIRSAPFPSAHCKAQMRSQIEALAMQGAPVVGDLIENDRQIVFQTLAVRSQVYNTEVPSVAFAELPDAVALFAWTFKDALVKRLDAEIDAEADDKAAMSHEARQKAEAEVMADLLAVERDECALVWQAQSQNLPCEHRADVSVAALLSIALFTTPRAVAFPETTPGYSWPLRR